jgi:hypothetical protein
MPGCPQDDAVYASLIMARCVDRAPNDDRLWPSLIKFDGRLSISHSSCVKTSFTTRKFVLEVIMKIVAYIVGFAAALGCIIVPLVTHASTHGTVALILFGLALLAAMILMVVWNKSGKITAGAGDVDMGLSANFDLDTWQWMVVFGIIVVGTVAAVLAGTLIKT